MVRKKEIEKELGDTNTGRDNFFNDVTTELNVDAENVDAIDSMIDIVNNDNLDNLSEKILNKYNINLEVEQIERMVIDFDLDTSSDRIATDLYNLYMKHYT